MTYILIGFSYVAVAVAAALVDNHYNKQIHAQKDRFIEKLESYNQALKQQASDLAAALVKKL